MKLNKFFKLEGLMSISLNDQLPFNYHIRRSKRVKTLRIVVTPGTVEVVAPLKMPKHRIHSFVQDKHGWVTRTKEKIERSQQQIKSFAPTLYSDGVEIPFQGGKFPLTVHRTESSSMNVEYKQSFIVSVPYSISKENYSAEIRQCLINWMEKAAKIVAENYVLQHAERCKLKPRSIKIKKQTGRWGSCGIHNDINLNWLLILAPPGVFEYVVVHELCHIRHRNHSTDFWNLVAIHMPEFQEQKKWLRQHGASLMLGL